MNQKGISMVQVVIAGAMAAGIGLYIAKMSQTASLSASGFRQQMAIEFIKRKVREAMKDTDACTATLKKLTNTSTAFSGDSVSYGNTNPQAGDEMDRIIYKNVKGEPSTLFAKDQVYDSVEITNITLDDHDALGIDTSDEGLEYIVINFTKNRGVGRSFGAENIEYRFPIDVNRDGNNFVSCADLEYTNMKKDICQGFGAVYDEDNDTCDIIGLDNGVIGCPPGSIFRGIQISSVDDEDPDVVQALGQGVTRRAIYLPLCETLTGSYNYGTGAYPSQADLEDLLVE